MSAGTLTGRVVLVTGAAGALGREVTEQFRGLGATVVGVDLHGDGCVHADVGTAEGNRAAIDHAVSEHGRLDVLVLNAGLQHVAPLESFPEERWRRLLDVMVTGPFLAIRHAWPHLTVRPGGRILVTASTSSFAADRFKSAYVAAKHGVLGLVKVAALEGAEHGLTANAVAPSWMRTPLVEAQVRERMALHGLTENEVISAMVEDHAAHRFVEVSEVAATLAFLAGPAASGITGACVPVDLGALA